MVWKGIVSNDCMSTVVTWKEKLYDFLGATPTAAVFEAKLNEVSRNERDVMEFAFFYLQGGEQARAVSLAHQSQKPPEFAMFSHRQLSLMDQSTAENENETDALVGSILSDRYRIDSVLGTGGMGAVYLAEQIHMRKRVAIKVLHQELTRMTEVVARFEREAMAAAHIEHPNVAAATDFGKLEDGAFFLVLEYVEGKNLRDEVDDCGPFAIERVIHIAQQILSALVRAHALGIVHRDLKPENILLVERDGDPNFVKVLDFGIAKVPVDDLVASNNQDNRRPSKALTQAGVVFGTPEYMAPEQALGQDVDLRADLYALGVMLFEMLTGSLPFNSPNKVAILGMVVSQPVPAMSSISDKVHVPVSIENFVRILLSKLAEDRPADAKAALIQLESAAMHAGLSVPRVMPFGSIPAMTASGQIPVLPDGPPSKDNSPATRATTALPDQLAKPTFQERIQIVKDKIPGLVERVKTTADHPQIKQVINSVRSVPKPIIVGTAVGAGLIGIILTVVIVSLARGPKTDNPDTTNGNPGPSASISAEPPKAPVQASEEQLAEAKKNGITALKQLLEKFPKDTNVLRALGNEHAVRNQGEKALEYYQQLVKTDPTALSLPEVQKEMVRVAKSKFKDNGATLINWLGSEVGSAGPDILYEIIHTPTMHVPTAKLAKVALKKKSVRGVATPALRIALLIEENQLKAGGDCRDLLVLFKEAKKSGDERCMPTLRRLSNTRGCTTGGFLGIGKKPRDCFPCLRKDHSLQDAIKAIDARTKKPK
jgi:eukaryotic-like serine/threonine-protein kinase